MTISAARRRQNEDSIRAAIDRLLRGQIPAGGGCDVKTLAQEAGYLVLRFTAPTVTSRRSSSVVWRTCEPRGICQT